MKKSSKLRLFALAMTLAVALAGCGSNVASADEDDSKRGTKRKAHRGLIGPKRLLQW